MGFRQVLECGVLTEPWPHSRLILNVYESGVCCLLVFYMATDTLYVVRSPFDGYPHDTILVN